MVRFKNNLDVLYAKKLRKLRVQNDYPQKTMAFKLGFKSQQNYSLLERGRKHFNKRIVKSICSVFNLSIEEFTNEYLGDKENKARSPGSEVVAEKEVSHLRTILDLKNEIEEYQKILQVLYSKLLIERDLKLIAAEIRKLSVTWT